MANDTSISRITADANTPVARKKNSSDAIDVSKLSFFNELLSIGKFEPTIPQPAAIPAPAPTQSDPNSKSKASSASDNKEHSDEDPDDAKGQSTSQPVFVAQPQQLSPPTDPAQKAKSPADDSRGKIATNKPSDKVATGQNVDPQVSSKSLDDNNITSTTNESPTASSAAANDLLAKNKIDPHSRSVSDGVKSQTQVNSASEAHRKERVAKDSNSNAAVDTKAGVDKSTKGKAAAGPSQPSAAEHGAIPVDKLLNDRVKVDSRSSQEDLPRNKRAERLAKQAANENSPSDDSSSFTEPIQANVSAIESASLDPTLAESVTSASINPTASSSPIVNVPPQVIPAAFTISSSGSAVKETPSIVGEQSSAVAAVRGGIATGNTSGTNAVPTASGSNTARSDQSRAEVVRASAGTPITAYQEKKLVQRVLRGVEQLANGGGQVRLRLHPPELGSLQMSLRMEAGQVFAKLEVENSTAKEALLNNVQTLKDRMSEQGMTVSAFEVEVSTDSNGSGTGGSSLHSDSSNGQESRWENAKSRFVQQNENRLSSETAVADRKPEARWTRTNGSLDLTV